MKTTSASWLLTDTNKVSNQKRFMSLTLWQTKYAIFSRTVPRIIPYIIPLWFNNSLFSCVNSNMLSKIIYNLLSHIDFTAICCLKLFLSLQIYDIYIDNQRFVILQCIHSFKGLFGVLGEYCDSFSSLYGI